MTAKDTAKQSLEATQGDLNELSQWLYDNPETAYQEYESSQKLAAYLGSKGFEVTYPAYGLDTAFEANVGTSGPRVVICCEYDALPEVGQACGHNIIATAALGAGIAVSELVEELGIRVTVLGTPAEEGGGGKVALIDAGAFEDASASMMIHPSPADMLDPSFQARQSFTVEYFGKESHAAFAPHLGINALDAFVQAYMNVSTLRQQLLPTDTVHCMVSHGGDASNIIPAHTSSLWGVRSADEARLEELVKLVMNCFEAAATATGCRLEITPNDYPYLNMMNNPAMAELFSSNSADLGRPMPTEEELGVGGGSSDMGNVSQVVPSIHPMIGIEADGAVNHQKEFAAATVTSSGQKAIHDGALSMAYTIIDMAEQDIWGRL